MKASCNTTRTSSLLPTQGVANSHEENEPYRNHTGLQENYYLPLSSERLCAARRRHCATKIIRDPIVTRGKDKRSNLQTSFRIFSYENVRLLLTRSSRGEGREGGVGGKRIRAWKESLRKRGQELWLVLKNCLGEMGHGIKFFFFCLLKDGGKPESRKNYGHGVKMKVWLVAGKSWR